MVSYENRCPCGVQFDNNCAHYLSNWMILNNWIKRSPPGCYCCTSGRPLRAKEMRNVFLSMGLKKSLNPPSGDCYIYCERNSDHQGHVYYGRKGRCVAGVGDGSFGADYYEYYSSSKDL